MEHQDASVPNGTVVRVFEAGYTIEDRVLRPASVVVAKGGPKAAPAQGADATGDGATAPEAENDNAANGGSPGSSP